MVSTIFLFSELMCNGKDILYAVLVFMFCCTEKNIQMFCSISVVGNSLLTLVMSKGNSLQSISVILKNRGIHV